MILDRNKWVGLSHRWDQMPFVMENLPAFFHIPFPPMIGKRIKDMTQKTEAAGMAETDKTETLVLFHDPGLFRTDIYNSVKGMVPEANNINLSGTFISKVFSGSYNTVPAHIKSMNSYLKGIGKQSSDFYIHYAYCPKCAEKYGSNLMVLFARVD